MMPALWMTVLRAGKSAMSLAAKARMLAASSMSRTAENMPGLAATVSSSTCLRRPAMMTWLPSLWKASARPRPIPEPPPVMRMVFPVVFMVMGSPYEIVGWFIFIGKYAPKISILALKRVKEFMGKSMVKAKGGAKATAKVLKPKYPAEMDPRVEALVREIIARVADKWTMLVLEALEEQGVVRFTRLGELVGGVSQKMLTKTVRQMERDGLVTRTVHPVIPPKVEYELTVLGRSLSEAFCGVWVWAEKHGAEIERAREAFEVRG
jgi:DNA-binding HxlR family transcriptional regulator